MQAELLLATRQFLNSRFWTVVLFPLMLKMPLLPRQLPLASRIGLVVPLPVMVRWFLVMLAQPEDWV